MRHITVLAATVACLTAVPTALAQLATWNGGNGNWTDPNWIVNGMLSTIPSGAQVTANIPLGRVHLDTGMSFGVGGVTLGGTGTLSGPGDLTISGGLIQNAGFLGADITLTGQGSTWTGGSWGSGGNRSTTVGSTGALQILHFGDADMARRTLTNHGSVTHLNGRVLGNAANPGSGIAATSIVNNGAWIDSTVFALEFLNTSASAHWTFTNNNTFTKQGSGLTVFTDVKFDSAGLVDVQEGTVDFNGGGTSGPNAIFHAEPGTAINFGGSIGFNRYTVNGSAFTGDGRFTSTYEFIMQGTIAASNLTLDGATIGGTHTLSGPDFLWTGDNIGQRNPNATTTLSPASSLQIDVTGDVSLIRRNLTNNGAVTHVNGRVVGNEANPGSAIDAASIFNNGAWLESTASALEFLNTSTSGHWSFTNNNTFTKQGSGLTVFTGVKFDSAGLVDVQEGTVDFNGGGTSEPTATFHAEPGTAINFGGSTGINRYTVNGSAFTGDGRFTSTYEFIMQGTIAASNLTFDGATMGGTHTLSGPDFLWTGDNIGQRNPNATTTLSPASSLQIDVTGDVSLIRRRLTNNGAVTHVNGRVVGNEANPGSAIDPASIINNGAWTESTALELEFFIGRGFWTFTNNNTFTKQGSGLTVFTGVKFDSTGLVDVQEGTVDFNGGGTSGPTATFHAEPGTSINFGGSTGINTYTVNGSAFTGDGRFTSTYSFVMQGTIEASNLTFDGATIGGTHTLSCPNILWTGDNIGARGGTASTLLTSTSSLEIDVAGGVLLGSRSLTNNGAVTHRDGSIGGDVGTSIVNNGTWTEAAAVPLDFGASWIYTNNGTFIKQGPESTIFSISRFDNAGDIDVQEGTLSFSSYRQSTGEMILSGGDVAGALTFTGGSLRGSGDLAGNVTMTGATLSPGLSLGLLNFGANLVLNSAIVPIQLEGTSRGTTYDAIDVAGSLSLGGSALQLDVTLLDPATPIGTEFLIFDKASAPAIGGTFGGLSQGARFNSGIFEFEITYLGGDGNDIVLTVTDSSFCYADCDGSGMLDIFDFLCFQNSFVSGELYACECDPDPACNIFDFLCFQNAFVGGCP